jgi:hypothetical protein
MQNTLPAHLAAKERSLGDAFHGPEHTVQESFKTAVAVDDFS